MHEEVGIGTKSDQCIRHSEIEAGESWRGRNEFTCLKRSEVGDGKEKVKAE